MPQRWRKILLSLLAAPILFTACKKQLSTDQPFAPSYTPSIIINSDNQVLYAINPANGVKNWEFSLPVTFGAPALPIAFQPSPLLYNEMIYMAGTQNNAFVTDTLYKINAKTGALVSKFVFAPGIKLNIQATPIAAGKLIYIAATNDTLYAVDTGTGTTQWKYGAGSNTASLISSPVIYNGMIYGANTRGLIYALDLTQTPLTTGDAVTADWTYQATGASFYSSPAVSAPYLYMGSVSDSSMYCIYLEPVTIGTVVSTTGRERWKYKTNGAIYSSPAADDGVCIFGSDDFNVYCLDTFIVSPATTPHARWIAPTRSTVKSSPVLVNNVVYIASYDYNLYALNIIDGTVKWTFASNALVKSSPLVYGSTVYIGSEDKNLYAIDTSGTLAWSYYISGQIECSPLIDDLSGIDQLNSQVSGYTN